MAAGVMDRLITRLELQDDFSKKAKSAADSAKVFSEEAEKMEQAAREVDDAMDAASGGVREMADEFKKSAKEAALANPVIAELALRGVGVARAMGTQLVPVLARAVLFMTGPGGIVVAAGAVGAALAAVSFGVGAMVGAFQAAIPIMVSLAGNFATVVAPLLAMPFLKASAEVDYLRRSYSAYLGSTEAGAQMVKFVEQYGLKSAIDQPPLQEMTRTLIASGLDVNRYLPVTEILSMAGGPDLNLNSQTIANAIRYAAGGRTGEAVENLGQVGIGRNQLLAFGAEFNNTGQFEGTFEEFMDVLERLTKSPRFQELKAQTEDSTAVKLSNAGDAFRLAMVKAGDTFSLAVLPIIEKATEWMQKLTSSGIVEKIALAFTSWLGDGGGMENLLILAVTVIESIPDLIAAAIGMMKNLANAVFAILEGLTGIPFFGKAIKAGLVAGRAAVAAVPTLAMAGIQWATEGRFGEKWAENRAKWRSAKTAEDEQIEAPPVPDLYSSPEGERQTALLAEIRDHTKQMANVSRIILGGGELGRVGVTAADVSGMRGGGRSGGGRLGQIVDIIGEFVEEKLEAERRARGNAYG